MTERETFGREDALFWLQERRGKLMRVDVQVDLGHSTALVFATEGTLRFWRDSPAAAAGASLDPARTREDVIGLFTIGEWASLDVTDLPDEAFSLDGPELHIDPTGEGPLWLTITARNEER
jgi:hypothetical protein